MITVAQLGQVFVKATQFLHPQRVEIDPAGIRFDRAFALVEADDRLVGSDQHGNFFPLKFDFDPQAERLRLQYADGRTLEGSALGNGRAWAVDHFGLRTISGAEVDGPWLDALSDFAGRSIRLVRCVSKGAAVDVLPVTLLTTGSLRRIAQEVGGAVDAARFRAGLVLDNSIEHEEDQWDGKHLRIGTALLRVRTPVPRCGITGFNPTSGQRDQEVMKGMIRYRAKASLPDGMLPDYATPGFASYAEVIEAGTVSVGDRVEVLT